MTRRRLPLVLAVAGVLIILASVVAAVVVRSSDTATLALGERPDVPVVVSNPGVLDAVDPEVTVRATAGDDEQVVLAIGRTSEVEAWLGDAEHMRVTGLSSWEELTVEVVTPTGAPEQDPEEPADLPDPAGSDLWVVETVGTGSAELSWSDSPGRWSLVAATDGSGPAPQIELEWGRQVATPWLVPGIVVGVLALVAGVTLLVLDVMARREQRRRDAARARGAEPPRSITDTDPGTGQRLTRRQIRELEQAERSGRGDETVPPVPLAGADDAALAPSAVSPVETEPAATDVTEVDTAVEPVDPEPVDPEPSDPQPAADLTDAQVTEADEPVPDEPVPVDAEPTAEEPDEEEDEGYSPAPPSWRSVWGFGGTAAPRTPPTQPNHDHDDDGEERR